jgi:hypothetical protein
MKPEFNMQGAREDLKRMRVYEQGAQEAQKGIAAMRNNFSLMYRSIFGVEPHRSPQLRRILEMAAQYGSFAFEQAIDEAKKIPERFPAEPYEVMFEDLKFDVARATLDKIKEHEKMAQKFDILEKKARQTGTSVDWQKAGEVAIEYIEAVGVDPSSRAYWQKLYEDFLAWAAKRSK